MSLSIVSPKIPAAFGRNRIFGQRVEFVDTSTVQITPGACRCSLDESWIETDATASVPLVGNLQGAALGGAETRLSVWACKPTAGAVYYRYSRLHTASAFAATQSVGTKVRRVGAVSVHTSELIRRFQSSGSGLETRLNFIGYCGGSGMASYDSILVLVGATATSATMMYLDPSRWFIPPGTTQVVVETYVSDFGAVYLAVEGDTGLGSLQQADHNFVLTREVHMEVPGGGNFAAGAEPRVGWRKTSTAPTITLGVRGVVVSREVYV